MSAVKEYSQTHMSVSPVTVIISAVQTALSPLLCDLALKMRQGFQSPKTDYKRPLTAQTTSSAGVASQVLSDVLKYKMMQTIRSGPLKPGNIRQEAKAHVPSHPPLIKSRLPVCLCHPPDVSSASGLFVALAHDSSTRVHGRHVSPPILSVCTHGGQVISRLEDKV